MACEVWLNVVVLLGAKLPLVSSVLVIPIGLVSSTGAVCAPFPCLACDKQLVLIEVLALFSWLKSLLLVSEVFDFVVR